MTLGSAVYHGNLNIVRYLFEENKSDDYIYAYKIAEKRKISNIMEYLKEILDDLEIVY